MNITCSYIDDGTISIHIPITFKKRFGRKMILSPDNSAPIFSQHVHKDHSLIRVLARSHKWNKLYEGGRYKSYEEMAKKLKVNPSYLARVMRVAALAPDIKEAILDGRQPRTLQVQDLLKPFPELWAEQRKVLVRP